MTNFANEFSSWLEDITIGKDSETISTANSEPTFAWVTEGIAKGTIQTKSATKDFLSDNISLEITNKLYLDLETSTGGSIRLDTTKRIIEGSYQSSEFTSTLTVYDVQEYDILDNFYQWATLEESEDN